MNNICTIENSRLIIPDKLLSDGEYIIVPEEINSLFLFDAEKFGDVMNDMVQGMKGNAQELIRYMLSNSIMAEVRDNYMLLPQKVFEHITVDKLAICDCGKYYELNVI